MSVFPIDPPYTYCAGGFLICPFLLSIKPLCCSLNLKHWDFWMWNLELKKIWYLDLLDDRNNNALLYNSTSPSTCPYRKCNNEIKYASRILLVIATVAKVSCEYGLWLVVRVNKKWCAHCHVKQWTHHFLYFCSNSTKVLSMIVWYT